MGWQEINIRKYVEQVKTVLPLKNNDDILEKDLLLTLILAEFEKTGLGDELIFKGGTLLSRNYLNYHRFSEDLDFVHKNSGTIRDMTRAHREREIKIFIDLFTPKLKEVTNSLGLEFSTDRSNTKFCTILHGRTVYIFRVYYSKNNFVKVEINFVEKMRYPSEKISVKAITDLFDSKELLFILGLDVKNFNVLSYSLKEIVLEKYRAVLTRNKLQERDLFDLFLIKTSMSVEIGDVVEKIRNSSLIKRELVALMSEKLDILQNGNFFKSEEKIDELAVVQYDKQEFEHFKQKMLPKLIDICTLFLKNEKR